MLKKILFCVGFSFICIFCSSQNHTQFLTKFENSDYKQTFTYDECIEFCKKLAAHSNMLKYQSIATSPQGREIPLLILDKNSKFNPEENSEKAILFVQAGIHAGESNGKEAGLTLIRDIVVYGKYLEFLDNVTLLYIPVFNVDGDARFGKHNRINQNGPEEMGWRTTAQNLNLNRDYMKNDAPEMKAWHKFFNKWLPDFFVDCHSTDGADYQYTLTYSLEIFGNMNKEQTDWQQNVYLNFVLPKLEEKAIYCFQYVSFRKWHDPRSGLTANISPPMLSHGYVALQNRPALLIETHMLKPYKQRVEATYEMLKSTLELINIDFKKLKEINKNADNEAISDDFRKKKMAVKFELNMNDSTMVDFLGVEYDITTSDITGGPWFQYHTNKPITYSLPIFKKSVADVEIDIPKAYIIPPECETVIKVLKEHGIETELIEEAKLFHVKSYKFSNPKWRKQPFEGRFPLRYFEMAEIEEERNYPKGSVIVYTNQRTAKIIIHLLEPKATDSFVHWGFFNSIFEQKEYSETYVMEKMAVKLFADNPTLEKEFIKKKSENETFSKSQWQQTNWLYSKTPYWDNKKDVYPIGRIF